jgi:hypothetical protein
MMDMAPGRNEWSSLVPGIDTPDCPSRRALDALQGATQAAMMMALVWPLVAGMPFFWAPPVWVMGGLARARSGAP